MNYWFCYTELFYFLPNLASFDVFCLTKKRKSGILIMPHTNE